MNSLIFVSFTEVQLGGTRSVVIEYDNPISNGNDISNIRLLARERANALGWKLGDISFWRRLEDEAG